MRPQVEYAVDVRFAKEFWSALDSGLTRKQALRLMREVMTEGATATRLVEIKYTIIRTTRKIK